MTAELEYEHPTVEDEARRLMLLLDDTPVREAAVLYRYQRPLAQAMSRAQTAHFAVLSLDNRVRK